MKVIVKQFADTSSWSNKELAEYLNNLLGNPANADTTVMMDAKQCNELNEKYGTDFKPYNCKVKLKNLYKLIKNAPMIDVNKHIALQSSINSETIFVKISDGKVITKSNKSPNNSLVLKLASILDNKRIYTNASKVTIEAGISSDNFGIFNVEVFKSKRRVTEILYYIQFNGRDYELISKNSSSSMPQTFKSLSDAQSKLIEYADKSVRYALFHDV